MPLVIDCHYHLEERYLSVDQMIARMDAVGINRVALMGRMTDPIPETPRPLVRILQFLLAHRATRPVSGCVGRICGRDHVKTGVRTFAQRT